MELWHTPEAFHCFHFLLLEENILLFAFLNRRTGNRAGLAVGLHSGFAAPQVSVPQRHMDDRDDKNVQLKIKDSIYPVTAHEDERSTAAIN